MHRVSIVPAEFSNSPSVQRALSYPVPCVRTRAVPNAKTPNQSDYVQENSEWVFELRSTSRTEMDLGDRSDRFRVLTSRKDTDEERHRSVSYTLENPQHVHDDCIHQQAVSLRWAFQCALFSELPRLVCDFRTGSHRYGNNSDCSLNFAKMSPFSVPFLPHTSRAEIFN